MAMGTWILGFFLLLTQTCTGVEVLEKKMDYSDYLSHKYYDAITADSTWVDISTLGILSTTSNADDLPSEYVDLGFDFPFYGHRYDSVLINPNGFLSFGTETLCPQYGFCEWGPIPYTRYIAPLMSDFSPSSSPNAMIHYLAGQKDGKKQFTVQWKNIFLWNSTHTEPGYSFQVILLQNGTIIFNYESIPKMPNEIYNPVWKKNYPTSVGIKETINLLFDGIYEPQPFNPVLFSPSEVSTSKSLHLVSHRSCVSFTNCYSCMTESLELDLKCGWCWGSKMCMDSVAFGITEKTPYCSSPKDLLPSETRCPNYPGIVAGAVIGSVLGAAIIIALIVLLVKRLNRKDHIGGKTGDELPQLPSQE